MPEGDKSLKSPTAKESNEFTTQDMLLTVYGLAYPGLGVEVEKIPQKRKLFQVTLYDQSGNRVSRFEMT